MRWSSPAGRKKHNFAILGPDLVSLLEVVNFMTSRFGSKTVKFAFPQQCFE